VLANENTLRHLDPYGVSYMVDVDEEKADGAGKIQSVDVYYEAEGAPVIVWSVREEGAIYFHR
jgi:hypothetical protein